MAGLQLGEALCSPLCEKCYKNQMYFLTSAGNGFKSVSLVKCLRPLR